MGETVLVLGPKGKFGRAAAEAFVQAGWTVRGLVRPGTAEGLSDGVMPVEGDAANIKAVSAAAEGVDVVVTAVNPAYTAWKTAWPRFQRAIMPALKESGATQIFPGNVYPYGVDMPATLDGDTPPAPRSNKGRLRRDLEARFQAAAEEDGIQTILLRCGDFFGGPGTGGWFDQAIMTSMKRGIFTWPGDPDIIHAWTYLPDVGDAVVRLAGKRTDLPPYAAFAFPGHNVTGVEMQQAAEAVVGRSLKRKGMPWTMMHWSALVSPMMWEITEMKYLWFTPHALDGAALEAAIGPVKITPLETAMRESLTELGMV